MMAAGTAPNIKTPKVDTSQLLDLLVQARQKSQTNTVQIVRPNVTKTVSEVSYIVQMSFCSIYLLAVKIFLFI